MSLLSFLEKLLDGAEVEWKALVDIATIGTGSRNTNESVEDGKYPFFVRSQKPRSINEYEFNETAIITAGDGVGVGKVFHYVQGKYALHQRAYRIAVTDKWVSSKYLFHYIKGNFAKYLEMISVHAAVTSLRKPMFEKYPVPIPCPSNPEKSLQIQAEIVRILDAFNEVTTELTVELNMRKKQCSHYRFEMFKFTEATQYLKIGECCDIKKGLTPIKKAIPGKYPLVATTEERQSSSEYQFDCAAVCVPLISSRGHGVASIDRIYFQDGKFALGNILCAIIPNDNGVLSAKFLRYYLFDKKDVLLVPLMRGGANVSLTVDSLKKVEIPIPPIAEQTRIVRILEKFDELLNLLPREIELRQKQSEYYRDLLLSFPKSDEAA